MSWVLLGLLGGVVGLDGTSFPQIMISRPLLAGTLTGALFGRPLDGLVIGFIMEAFSLITLPIGAARYPESGTAAVAAVGAYMAAVEPGLAPGALVIAVAFGFGWEWLAGETVVLQRRSNGQLLTRHGTLAPRQLSRAHMTAMTTDLVRGGVVAVSGALTGYGLFMLLNEQWGLPDTVTLGVTTLLVATMIGATLPLFGGVHERRRSWAVGIAVGVFMVTLL